MIRKIIHIDEEKCNGCGLCAEACHEGAIDIIDGKAKLVRENFCDGFGDCLPGCPTGAITFEEREAPEYDEKAVKEAKEKKTMDEMKHEHHEGGCPGSRMAQFDRSEEEPVTVGRSVSRLAQWPCQIKFQKAGFEKKRLFYTQGDYGLFQSVNPAIRKTYDNEEWVMKAMEAQGFFRDSENVFQPPKDGSLLMRIPTKLIPKCPDDGSDVTTNLRCDDSFVENEGWKRASAAYSDFLRRHERLHVLYLEIGIGMNTPVICKYPFWQMTNDNPKAVYACLNFNEAYCPVQIEKQSICIDGDSAEVIKQLL